MTFDEAVSMIERIKDIAVNVPVKGRFIQSFFIGPTDWKLMATFMTIRVQKGEDAAISEFLGKSFSVYGVSETNTEGGIPRSDMSVLDDFEKIIGN
jgi:hypothetical protein